MHITYPHLLLLVPRDLSRPIYATPATIELGDMVLPVDGQRLEIN